MATSAAPAQPTLDVQVERANKIYQPQEIVTGTIALKNSEKPIPFESV